MDLNLNESEESIGKLIEANQELQKWKQDYASSKQSLKRMASRLRKLCKRLTPSSEIVIEMQKISNEIRDLVKEMT